MNAHIQKSAAEVATVRDDLVGFVRKRSLAEFVRASGLARQTLQGFMSGRNKSLRYEFIQTIRMTLKDLSD